MHTHAHLHMVHSVCFQHDAIGMGRGPGRMVGLQIWVLRASF